ncbi:hypothetical protein CAPTEDRAFT_211021 [Capitella teleta]|uniref:Uncharacterized protein n=1 Tax=Capitella teleta TaxID=283909 RepID=R7VFX9_CAPTE|nr:hypothetical protein CAPTEDRAFT_211021 [Capitella teleta]|eukprot:ELU14590.1 hypothetical protein CAPTEDRAFT_211021 [Capitella teleta]
MVDSGILRDSKSVEVKKSGDDRIFTGSKLLSVYNKPSPGVKVTPLSGAAAESKSCDASTDPEVKTSPDDRGSDESITSRIRALTESVDEGIGVTTDEDTGFSEVGITESESEDVASSSSHDKTKSTSSSYDIDEHVKVVSSETMSHRKADQVKFYDSTSYRQIFTHGETLFMLGIHLFAEQ